MPISSKSLPKCLRLHISKEFHGGWRTLGKHNKAQRTARHGQNWPIVTVFGQFTGSLLARVGCASRTGPHKGALFEPSVWVWIY